MKTFTIASLVAAVSAHSWLECTNHDDSEIRGWMKGNSTFSPPVIIDPAMPWYSQLCAGWPRNKANPGNWLDESSNYIWNIGANSWDGGAYHPADTHACHPSQRSPTYQANAPMASAAPGGVINLRFGGNGHTRGAPMNDAGSVTVYWKGKPEAEITDVSEFTAANTLQTAGFGADSFSYPADPNVVSPTQGLVDKGNWLKLKLPADIAPGRHMMVWVWSYSGAKQWSTCFDINVSGSGSGAVTVPETKEAATVPEVIPVVPVPAPVAEPSYDAPKTDTPSAPGAYMPREPLLQKHPQLLRMKSHQLLRQLRLLHQLPQRLLHQLPQRLFHQLPQRLLHQLLHQLPLKRENKPKKHCKAKYERRGHARAFA